MGRTTVAATGILGNLLFWGSLFTFAALRPGYSHFTKAISELGGWGAPHMWYFNVLGFISPGILIALCGWGLGRLIAPRGVILPLLLALPGVGTSIAGVFPGDMSNYGSLTTRLHLSGQMIGLTWLPAMALIAIRIRGTWRALAILSIIALIATVDVFSLYDVTPYRGLIQRLTFAVWLGWYFAASLWLLSGSRPSVLTERKKFGTK